MNSDGNIYFLNALSWLYLKTDAHNRSYMIKMGGIIQGELTL